MTTDEAGRLREEWKAQGNPPCSHERMLEPLISKERVSLGKDVCRECGTILSN